MELRHLRYFLAVAEEENVTRAAARLHVSQPPLTRQIRDLEEELGVSLFERTGRSIRLTNAGRLFLEETRDVLGRLDEAVKKVKAEAHKGCLTLRVAYAPSPTARLLPEVLRSFRETYPEVHVSLHDLSSPEMLAGLREGNLEAAFMVEQVAAALVGIRFEPLRKFAIGIIVPQSHRWADRKTVSLEEVAEEPLVVYDPRMYPDYHELLQRVFGGRTDGLKISEESDSGTSLMAAVETGCGVAITAEWQMDVSGGRLRFLPINPAPDPAVVGIAYREGEDSPALLTLREFALRLKG